MCACFDTRFGQAYASVGEILPDQRSAQGPARAVASQEVQQPGVEGFSSSDALYGALAGWLAGEEAQALEHGELEERLESRGRELVRQLYQDSIDLRAAREQRLAPVVGSDGVARSNVERAHERSLQTVFGEVTVSRLAYRARGAENLYVADAVLDLPEEKHSHGLRKLAALGTPQGSFEDLREQIRRHTGVEIGKRQVEELALRAAVDFEAFYRQRERDSEERREGPLAERVLVLSCDGKGVVMRPEALRPENRRKAESSQRELGSRLSKGEKRARKRIAEVTAVYEIKPVPRTPADVLPATEQERQAACDGPEAKHKWVSASVTDDAARMIERMFEEAQRRDPDHERQWVALVDGNNHQIDRIRAEARPRKLKIHIVVDCVHVLEYLWGAARSFFAEGDPAAERWVKEQSPRGPRRQSQHCRGVDPPQSHPPWPRRQATRERRHLRRLPTCQTPLPGLPHRARPGLADRDRRDRGRLSPFGEGPYGHHRRPLGSGRRRSRAQATRPQSHRRYRCLLALSPRARTHTRTRTPLRQRRNPYPAAPGMRSLQKSRTHPIPCVGR